jgi:hypothetical protein
VGMWDSATLQQIDQFFAFGEDFLGGVFVAGG